MTTRRVLRLGDTAGVGALLDRALTAHTAWRPAPVTLPATGAGRSPLLHAAGQVMRVFQLPVVARRAIGRERPDVVHVHWARLVPFVPTGGVPLVAHVHGSDVRGHGRSRRGRFVARSLRDAAAVLVSTPDLLDEVPAGAIHLPNPVDTEFFRPADDRTACVPEVLLFARLSRVKGADVLLAATRELLRLRPDVNVRAFGGTEYDRDALAAGVRLLPAGDRDAVRDALRRADVVIGQQAIGALGLSELEAMAVGLPVIVPLDTGRFDAEVPVACAYGAEEVAARCAALLDQPADVAALGAAARRYVEGHHAFDVVAPRLAEIYESIA